MQRPEDVLRRCCVSALDGSAVNLAGAVPEPVRQGRWPPNVKTSPTWTITVAYQLRLSRLL